MEIGDKIGDLEIISIDRKWMSEWKQPRFRVRVLTKCICGTTKEYDLHGLKCYGQKKCAKCSRNHGQSTSTEYRLWSGAKRRARDAGLPFDIDWRDIHIPETCPLLEIPIVSGSTTTDNSPSIDRIIPSKGYVKNIWLSVIKLIVLNQTQLLMKSIYSVKISTKPCSLPSQAACNLETSTRGTTVAKGRAQFARGTFGWRCYQQESVCCGTRLTGLCVYIRPHLGATNCYVEYGLSIY